MDMAKQKTFDIDAFEKRFDSALESVAIVVGEEIEAAFERAIVEFYSSYHQTVYERTESLFKLSSGYPKGANLPLWKKKGKLSYEAGIDVKPKYVPGNPYKKIPPHGLNVDTEWVFDVSYMKGIHGFNIRNVRTTKKKWKPGYSNKRKEFTNLFSEFRIPLSMYQDVAANDFSLFRTKESSVPTNSTPPDDLMRKSFKDIKNNMEGRLSAALSNIL